MPANISFKFLLKQQCSSKMSESNGNSTPETTTKQDDVEEKDEKKGDDTELTSLDKQIIRQIEYYFGDINLGRDKFLQEQVKIDDGWVPLEIMLKFNRLANLSKDAEVILTSLAKSSNELMEISEDRKKIRRSPNVPLPIHNEERRKEILSRSVYSKGFPATGFNMDDGLSYFTKYGGVENVQLRNYKDKATNQWIFKGSVYTVFKSIDDAKAFIDLESVKHGDIEITRKWLSEHVEEKRIKYAEKRTNSKQERTKAEPEEPKESILTKGAIVHLTGFTGDNDIAREDIKKDLKALGGNVLFVDFKKGDSEGWVRLDKENAAKELLEKMENGKVEIGGIELTVEALEGEVEDAYLAKSLEAMKQRRLANRGGRGRGFRGGGRGRGNFRGGRGGNRSDKRKGSPMRGEGSSHKKRAV